MPLEEKLKKMFETNEEIKRRKSELIEEFGEGNIIAYRENGELQIEKGPELDVYKNLSDRFGQDWITKVHVYNLRNKN